jgi:hypothetical protein
MSSATITSNNLACKSESAVAAFLAFCERKAFDLLAEHVTVLMSMQITASSPASRTKRAPRNKQWPNLI